MERSEIMRRVRSKNTAPEMIVRRRLHRLGYRYGLHRNDLPGHPDIVMPAHKAAIFVHGCWWHGHGCKRGIRKATVNVDYWNAKIAKNVRRDSITLAALRRSGWRVAVVWECRLSKDVDGTIARLQRFLQSKSSRSI